MSGGSLDGHGAAVETQLGRFAPYAVGCAVATIERGGVGRNGQIDAFNGTGLCLLKVTHVDVGGSATAGIAFETEEGQNVVVLVEVEGDFTAWICTGIWTWRSDIAAT